MQVHKSYRITSPRTLHLTGIMTHSCPLIVDVVCGLRSTVLEDWLEHLVLLASASLGEDEGVHF